MFRFSIIFLTSILICNSFQLKSQVSIPDSNQGLEKHSDTTTLTFYESIKWGLRSSFQVLDPFAKVSYNSTYARGYNDGPIWKGKGTNVELHGGITGVKGRLSYTLHPALFYAQNLRYDIPSTSSQVTPFAYPYSRNIDWVQRYGDNGYVGFHPGQSELRLTWGKFKTAIGTQNYSLGPSVFNPILISRQAGGFPHIRIGTDPFDFKLFKKEAGKLEVNFLLGYLFESAYFDSNEENDQRYFNSLSLAYQPKFLPELTLGFNKVLYKNTQFFEPVDLASVLYIFDAGTRGDSIDTNDTFDQLASISMDWNFKSVGFRVYSEFAKNDFTGGPIRFLEEAEHSRAFTIGFEKRLRSNSGNRVILNYEHSNLSRNHTFLWRAEPTFFIHSVNKQGYTNNGQIVGAGIGPGGNSDNFRISIEKENELINFLIQRIETNKDYFVVNIQNDRNHDLEYSMGFGYQKQLTGVLLGVQSTFSYNLNKYYIEDKFNVYMAMSVRYLLN